MKISPLASGNAGNPSSNLHGAVEGSHSPDRVARAKAIAAGEGSVINVTEVEQPAQPRPDVRRIKMNTNATVLRDSLPDTQESIVEASTPVESPISDTNATPPVIEDTKPLSPQFAALAKQRRALQAKERELADREKALTSQSTSVGTEELVARLKSQPLSVLQEHGVTYDQLTEAILSNQSGTNPEIFALKQEIKALKEGVDKTLSDKDAQAEAQVLSEIQRDVNQRAREGNDFEMIRETRSQGDVKELIHRTWKETGEVLDVSEAMTLVENELINESLKIANISKVRSRLAPSNPSTQQQQNPRFKTLTNRDTAKPVMDRKARALAAALGTLRK